MPRLGLLWSLFAVGSVLLLLGLSWTPLLDWDENIYAEITRQMVVTGDYWNLTINNQPFAEKPPLFFWCMALFFKLLGVGETGARLTSVLSAIAMSLILYRAGARIKDSMLGLLWAAMYASSLIPLFAARMAAIDYFFNALITVAALALFFYNANPKLSTICLAGLFMGLAVLTKGPLGGVIPLVAFFGMKLVTRDWRLSPLHFALCGAIALCIAASYYVGSYFISGPEFLKGFVEFQRRLLATPLDSHDGPFYYHFVAALIGLFPFTAFLFLWVSRPARVALMGEHRSLIWWALSWVAFVLLVFSIVRTKLPHYSASMYVPLTLLLALAVHRLIDAALPLPRALKIAFVATVLLFAGIFGALPYLLEPLSQKSGVILDPPVAVHTLAFVPGLVLLALAAVCAVAFFKERLLSATLSAALAMLLFALSMWGLVLPAYAQYNQGPVLRLMHDAHSNNGYLFFYRYLSFAAFFYGQRKIEVLYSYKFHGNPELLKSAGPVPYYVICPRSSGLALRNEFPLVTHVRDQGNLSLYLIPAGARK